MTPASSLILTDEEGALPGLTGGDAGELESANRRRFPRIALPPDASVRLHHGVSARLLDLGLGGALVEASTRLVPGTVTGVRLTVGDVDIRATARVRRASISGAAFTTPGESRLVYRAGLEFDALSPTDVKLLKATLASAAQAAAEMRAGTRPADIPGAPASERMIATGSSSRLVSVRLPPGWVVTRNESGMAAREPNRRGFAFVRRLLSAQSPDLCEFAQGSMREVGFSAIHCRQAEINGLEACVGFYHGWLDGLGEAIAEAAHIVVHDRTYVVAGVAGWAAYDTLRHAFFGTIRSFVAGPSTTDSVALSDEALNDEALNDEDCPSAPEAGDDGAGLSRRQHLRVAGPFDGYRLGLLKTPVRVYDLSEGGCFINSLIETTTKGQRFGLKILLPSEGWITVEAAEAIYTRPGFGFAVRFVKLQEYTRARLNQALCKLQSRRDGSASESHSV